MELDILLGIKGALHYLLDIEEESMVRNGVIQLILEVDKEIMKKTQGSSIGEHRAEES